MIVKIVRKNKNWKIIQKISDDKILIKLISYIFFISFYNFNTFMNLLFILGCLFIIFYI
jgi:hypothetical protein